MHTFDFSFPDSWSRKKIKSPTSRKPGDSSDVWNNVYRPADDWSRLKWPGEAKMIFVGIVNGVQRRHLHDGGRVGATWR